MALHPVTERVTARIVERSRRTRADYLARVGAAAAAIAGPARLHVSCGNLATGVAAAGED
jgi:phosphogluconate dehydratase